MKPFKKKYVKVRNDIWKTIRLMINNLNVNEELKEFLRTGFSPNEINLMSERLTEFELAELEPKEVRELADRDKAIKAERKYNLLYCPVCGNALCTPEYAEKIKFCNGCGKRVDTDILSATSVMPKIELGEKTTSKASEIFSERGEIDIVNRGNERNETVINFDE